VDRPRHRMEAGAEAEDLAELLEQLTDALTPEATG
jgi:hypothetical protein